MARIRESEENNPSQLLTARAVARMLSTSVRSVFRYRSCGRLPASVKLLGAVRWRQADIEAWIQMGCPPRTEFEARKEVAR